MFVNKKQSDYRLAATLFFIDCIYMCYSLYQKGLKEKRLEVELT